MILFTIITPIQPKKFKTKFGISRSAKSPEFKLKFGIIDIVSRGGIFRIKSRFYAFNCVDRYCGG